MESTSAARRWSALIAQQERSGLSIRQFARERGLNANTLAWWRWECRRRRSVEVEGGFTELVVVDDAAVVRPLLLELETLNVRVPVDGQTDLALLRRVLEALC
jgi:hypothetical protein